MDENNTKNVTEVERVKWLISRIDLFHKNTLKSIDNGQAIFQNAGDKGSNRIKGYRRGIFSILAAIVTVFFGINSFQPLESSLFYSILVSITSIGTINYFLFGWIHSFVENGFDLIFEVTHESKNRIEESQGFITTHFADLGFLDVKTIKNYGVFALLLGIAIQVNMMNKFKKEKSYKTSWVANTLKDEFKGILETTKDVPELYKRFDNTQIFPKTCFDLVEKTLKKYSK